MAASRRHPSAGSTVGLVALVAMLATAIAPAGASAASGVADPRSATADGTDFVPGDVRSSSEAAAERIRDAENARITAGRHPRSRPGVIPSRAGQVLNSRMTRAVDDERDSVGTRPAIGTSSTRTSEAADVAPGLFTYHRFSWATANRALDGNGAILGSTMFFGAANRLYANSISAFESGIGNWSVVTFFKIPAGEYFWSPAVAASIYRGRWVAVVPSFEGPAKSCAHGWLNVAVSTTSDPTKAWTRYRFSMGDAWTDEVNVGTSDDKVVLATNQWDLDTAADACLGDPFEGARLRVLDWTDLIDGGTVTMRDVTPSGPTNYWNWVPATNVPTTAALTAGTTIQLAGDKNVGGWGHAIHATITGSAKAATAKVAINEDLTTIGSVSLLLGPPATIAAFSSGNGFMDERVISSSYRSGRLWFTSMTTCRLDPDPTFRACARFVQLDTTTSPPTVLDDASFVDVERDTFLPLAGFSRDGTTYLTMAGSSAIAHEPIDQYATSRAAGAPIFGGEEEQKIWDGDQTFDHTYWSDRGSVMVEPRDARGVWALYPVSYDLNQYGDMETHLKGGLTGSPDGGAVVVSFGTNWLPTAYCFLTFYPLVTSPTQLVRWSVSPETEATATGPRLVYGHESRSISQVFEIDLTDPELGGITDPPSVTVYVQWQTQDGTWSTPISAPQQLDPVPPTFSGPRLAYSTGTVGTTVPVRISWTASDDLSGIGGQQVVFSRLSPTSLYSVIPVPVDARTLVRALMLGAKYASGVFVQDRAGNGAGANGPTVTFGAVQNTSSAIGYHGTWTTSSSSNFLGGSARYATASGAWASYTFTGRAVGFVTTKAKSRGKVEVWIDGVRKATLDLYSSTTHYRQLVYQTSWPTAGTHTIRIKVLGTASRPRVDFDAFVKF